MKGDLSKLMRDSLKFLENKYVRNLLILILVLYCAAVLPALNREVTIIFNNLFFKLVVLVVIVYVGQKDMTLALLLTMALILSLQRAQDNNMQESILGLSMQQPLNNGSAPLGNDPLVNCWDDEDNNACQGVATFENELNAQGLNYPVMGYNPDATTAGFFN
tara:strand:+ start:2745 stop:3230 length:486 start_codon:yes stop_codon:yes gene_type:complete